MRSRRWSQSWPLAADPVFGGCQPSRVQTTGAHPPGLFRTDQPALFQHLQMLQHRRQRHRQRPGEIADRGRAAAQPLHDRAPARIGQCVEHAVEGGAIVSHMANYSASRADVNDSLQDD